MTNQKKRASQSERLNGLVLMDKKQLAQILQEFSKQIKQSEEDRRKFGKLVNIKRGLS